MGSKTPKLTHDGPTIEWKEIELHELDLDWTDEPAAESGPLPRESRTTLVDANPLRHDRAADDEAGESRPTVLDIDPLRHDRETAHEPVSESRPTLPAVDPLRYDRDV